MTHRRVVAALVAVVLTCDVGLLLTGSHRWQGPTILAISPAHGLHAADPLVIALWVAAVAGCWWWASPFGGRRDR